MEAAYLSTLAQCIGALALCVIAGIMFGRTRG